MGQVVRDLTDQHFGRLTVLERGGTQKNGRVLWVCVCDCGGLKETAASSLKNGITRSCGCLSSGVNKKHGKCGTQVHRAWLGMRARCRPGNTWESKNYADRGIKVCCRWQNSFKNFYADMGDPPPGHTLDRKKNAKGYSPGNCRWATLFEQANNKRTNALLTLRGRQQPVAAWCKEFEVPLSRVTSRLWRGWTLEEALTLPPLGRGG